MSPPRLVLVTGLPGTGKSTVADEVARLLDSAVLSHDWAMSGLRPFPEIQSVLDRMEPSGHRRAGWSILNAMAQCQLRAGRSVVLDGVARFDEIRTCRKLARDEGTGFTLVVTTCSAPEVHRSRIENRSRKIPNWYELNWSRVLNSIATWEGPEDADVELDSARPLEDLALQLRDYFASPE